MGFKFKEIPIAFLQRYKGESKLNFRILARYLIKVLKLRVNHEK
jgi:hypothetical protein